MIQFKKLISSTLCASIGVTLSLAGVATAYAAGSLTTLSSSLTDTRSNQAGVGYTVKFTTASSNSIQALSLQWTTTPSGTASAPTNFDASAVGTPTLKDGSNAAITGWTLGTGAGGHSPLPTSSKIYLDNASGYSTGGQMTISIVLPNLHNNDATLASGNANQCDSLTNSETCYIRINTYTDDAGTVVQDSGVVSYTVVSAVQATATVDPSLTFAVNGVTNTNVGTASYDSNAACPTVGLNVTTTSVSIPFGDLLPNQTKCAQQSLTVTTNASSGYDVLQSFNTTAAGGLMNGAAAPTVNKIDADGNGATWAVPTTFSTPTSTVANTNSGWLGVRSNNTGALGASPAFTSGSNLYAPPVISNDVSTGQKVMDASGPDTGASYTIVTLKISIDAAQPADTYTGNMMYSVLPKY